ERQAGTLSSCKGRGPRAASTRESSVEIRAAQIETALRALQLAAVINQFSRAIRAETRGIGSRVLQPRPVCSGRNLPVLAYVAHRRFSSLFTINKKGASRGSF